MQHPRWRAGRLSTGFIAEEFPERLAPSCADRRASPQRMAAVAAAFDHVPEASASADLRPAGWRPVVFDRAARGPARRARLVEVEVARRRATSRSISPARAAAPASCAVVRQRLAAGRAGLARARSTASRSRVQVRPVLNGFALSHRGVSAEARVYTAREAELAAPDAGARSRPTRGKALLCPMPGLVRSIAVVVGQEVKAGEPLCVVEAMKMENVLRAERDATVKTIRAKPGDSLAVDAVIMEFA